MKEGILKRYRRFADCNRPVEQEEIDRELERLAKIRSVGETLSAFEEVLIRVEGDMRRMTDSRGGARGCSEGICPLLRWC